MPGTTDPPVEGTLPPEVLAELCRRHGGHPPVVAGRWVGATSTVLRAGDLCLKVPHADPVAVEACLTHARVAPLARRLGVRAQEVLAVERPPGTPVPVVVCRFLPGAPVRRDRPWPRGWRELGADLARLHRAPSSEAPQGLRTFTQSDAVDPARLARDAHDAGLLSRSTADLVAALREELAQAVLPDDRPVLCHGDVHTDNVLVRAGSYAGLLDFAGAGWLDAAWDFAAVPEAAVAPMVEGYAGAGGRTSELRPRVAWCRLQLALGRLGDVPDPDLEAGRALAAARRIAG